jgi:hypothetical protein
VVVLQLQVVVVPVVVVDVDVVVDVQTGSFTVFFGTQYVDMQSPEPVAHIVGLEHSQLGAAVVLVVVLVVVSSLGQVHSPSAMQNELYTE